MFHARPTASRMPSTLAALLITATWSGLAAAQLAATPGDQWRAAGTSSSASSQSAATSSPNTAWQLPNGQSNTGGTQLIDEDSNPLRRTRKPLPAAKAPEPRSFAAPANAAPIAAAKPATNNTNNNARPAVQKQTGSAAVATRPAAMNAQGYIAQLPQFNRTPATLQRPPYVQPNYRPTANNQYRSNSSGENLWDTI